MVGDGRGVTRPENDNNTVFTSPISKKFIQKSRSVSDIRKSFLEEKSGEGGTSPQEKLENSHEVKHALSSTQNQNWRLKLQQFKPDNLDNGRNSS